MKIELEMDSRVGKEILLNSEDLRHSIHITEMAGEEFDSIRIILQTLGNSSKAISSIDLEGLNLQGVIDKLVEDTTKQKEAYMAPLEKIKEEWSRRRTC